MVPYTQLLTLVDEQAYRDYYKQHFVSKSPIITFDGIAVRFRLSHHVELLRKEPEPNTLRIFCQQRAERLPWVLEALQDPDADIYFGYDKSRKRVDFNRRVAIVNWNYAVIIRLAGKGKAEFISAYPMDDGPLALARTNPRWTEKDCQWTSQTKNTAG